MIYSRRIDLPKEVLHVADENLRGNIDVFVDEIVLKCWITRILGRDGKEVSSPSERKGAFLDQADRDYQCHTGECLVLAGECMITV